MRGIDVSHWQGKIDWKKVADSGIEFVIIKAMHEGTLEPDVEFKRNYDEAGKYGLKRGVYIFTGNTGIQNPEKEAKAFLKILDGRKLEMGIWFDFEHQNLAKAGKAKIEDIAYKYKQIFEGYSCGVYTNMNWYKNILPDSVRCIFKLWVARYPANDRGIMAYSLNPKDVVKNSIGWQFTTKGRVDGINGNVDIDEFWEMPAEAEPKAPEIYVVCVHEYRPIRERGASDCWWIWHS